MIEKREIIGKIGILGPIRMDYRTQIQNVKLTSNNLKLAIDKMLRWDGEDDKDLENTEENLETEGNEKK